MVIGEAFQATLCQKSVFNFGELTFDSQIKSMHNGSNMKCAHNVAYDMANIMQGQKF